MDTTAYLTRQGWRGDGYALHASGRGIKKPLLLSKKNNTLGVGKKLHDAHADQWWSRAFDETLRSINGERHVDETTKANVAAPIKLGIYATKWSGSGGLYGNFVRGDGLMGTIEEKEVVMDYDFDRDLPTKKSRVNKAEKGIRKQEERVSKKAVDQRDGDSQSSEGSVKAIEICSEEASTGPVVDVNLVAEAASPHPKSLKKKRKKKHPEGDIGTLLNDTMVDATRQSEASTGEGYHGDTNQADPPGQAADVEFENAQGRIQTSQRRQRTKERRLEKEALKVGPALGRANLEDRSEPQVKKKRRRRKDVGQ